MAIGEAGIREIFVHQAQACEQLGSPHTGRVCRLLAARLDPGSRVGETVFGWQGDPGPGADSVPLRLCGALNNLVITGQDAELEEVYPPNNAEADDDALWEAIAQALEAHADHLLAFLKSAPQTNEVRRSAVLLAGWCWLSAHFGKPLVVSEVGASAGLNLFADRFTLKTDEFERGTPGSTVVLPAKWHGEVPPQAELLVAGRRGCDLAPIDATVAQERNRLLSYIWPDQRDRVERTLAAIDIAAAEETRSPVDKADAAAWLESRLAEPFEDAVHLVQHTIAWQYFPGDVKARGEALLREAGARATANRPLARLSLEADGNNPGAAITLTLWPGKNGKSGKTHALGRADYHGRWVDWRNPAL